MRYSILLSNREPAPGEIPDEELAAFQEAFDAYAKALSVAGILRAAEVLAPIGSARTLTLRGGTRELQEGLGVETEEPLSGIFIIEVPDLDTALDWAEKCPGARYGTVVVRPALLSFLNGSWQNLV